MAKFQITITDGFDQLVEQYTIEILDPAYEDLTNPNDLQYNEDFVLAVLCMGYDTTVFNDPLSTSEITIEEITS